MAENVPTGPEQKPKQGEQGQAQPTPGAPGGEAPKIQPKKETVRISLPPKPKSAPTIKIPRPKTAAPSGAPAAAPAQPAAAAPKRAAAAPGAAAPAGGAPAPGAQPKRPAAGPTPGPTPRPVVVGQPAAAQPSISPIDIGLGIAAAVLSLAALVRVFLLSGILQ